MTFLFSFCCPLLFRWSRTINLRYFFPPNSFLFTVFLSSYVSKFIFFYLLVFGSKDSSSMSAVSALQSQGFFPYFLSLSSVFEKECFIQLCLQSMYLFNFSLSFSELFYIHFQFFSVFLWVVLHTFLIFLCLFLVVLLVKSFSSFSELFYMFNLSLSF
jgi:hypothetical protein